jgi:serpin B
MGMPRAFSPGMAEFDGIAAGLHIARVIHKAWIQVDETGTEAAAATAVMASSVKSMPHIFAVDRSFLFFIHDQHGNVLFGGRVIDPS